MMLTYPWNGNLNFYDNSMKPCKNVSGSILSYIMQPPEVMLVGLVSPHELVRYIYVPETKVFLLSQKQTNNPI